MTNPNLEGSTVCINKPPGISSFEVVRQIRRATGVKRVGHAGTLDPFAEGVLVVGIGRMATRTLGTVTSQEKEYLADVRLGISTDTGDPTGKVIADADIPELNERKVTACLQKFIGTIEQIPPAFSAIKVDGKRLYKLARQGIEVKVESRQVTISRLVFVNFTPTGFQMQVVCSKGTYIRVLAEDIGKALGTVAHLKRLIRTRVGSFVLADAEDLSVFVARLNAERQSA